MGKKLPHTLRRVPKGRKPKDSVVVEKPHLDHYDAIVGAGGHYDYNNKKLISQHPSTRNSSISYETGSTNLPTKLKRGRKTKGRSGGVTISHSGRQDGHRKGYDVGGEELTLLEPSIHRSQTREVTTVLDRNGARKKVRLRTYIGCGGSVWWY